jgi:hypothetical protein
MHELVGLHDTLGSPHGVLGLEGIPRGTAVLSHIYIIELRSHRYSTGARPTNSTSNNSGHMDKSQTPMYVLPDGQLLADS